MLYSIFGTKDNVNNSPVLFRSELKVIQVRLIFHGNSVLFTDKIARIIQNKRSFLQVKGCENTKA
jgi:hypothetical protein